MDSTNGNTTEQPAPEAGHTFDEMGLRPEVRRALDEMGFAAPMEVQTAVFSRLTEGKDLLVQSRTGSGKTAAFAIPFANQILDPALHEVQALILCPTRELALQVATESGRISQHCGMSYVPVYGGAPMGRQIEALRAGAVGVAGTPGRVLDHLRRGTLKLGHLRVLVLDEADEMLSMGFAEDIHAIVERCPSERQTLLFSATIPDDIERIARKYMRSPERVSLSDDFIGVAEVKHAFYLVSGLNRTRDLTRILEVERPESAIVFCNTREETNIVADHMRRMGLDAEPISSDLTQSERERVMGLMRAEQLKYLVATDIAARGIDISHLSHVINYTFPESAEVYVHRTGRTGRAGRSGMAISLISPHELGNFYYLKLTYKIRPEERQLPSDEELSSRREGARVQRLLGELVGAAPGAEWRALARRIWASDDGEAIFASLIERHLKPLEANPRPAPRPAPPRAATDEARAESPATEAPRRERSAPSERTERPAREPRGRSERGRGERSKPDRGSRSSDRGERRPRRTEPHAPTPAPAEAAPPTDGPPTLAAEGDQDFWEVWVKERGGVLVADAEPAPRERPRPAPAPSGPPGTTRLYLNLGRRDGLSLEQVEEFVAGKGVRARSVDLLGTHSYLTVADEDAEAAVQALSGATHGERTVQCEPAKPRQ